jgi:hypothetical protein
VDVAWIGRWITELLREGRAPPDHPSTG